MNHINKDQTTSNIDLCLRCRHNIDEPKLLPCGYTLCTCCEKEIKSIGHFDCTQCGKTHVNDNNELPVNQSLEKLKKVLLNKLEEKNKLSGLRLK
jgi:hypothetical protein